MLEKLCSIVDLNEQTQKQNPPNPQKRTEDTMEWIGRKNIISDSISSRCFKKNLTQCNRKG